MAEASLRDLENQYNSLDNEMTFPEYALRRQRISGEPIEHIFLDKIKDDCEQARSPKEDVVDQFLEHLADKGHAAAKTMLTFPNFRFEAYTLWRLYEQGIKPYMQPQEAWPIYDPEEPASVGIGSDPAEKENTNELWYCRFGNEIHIFQEGPMLQALEDLIPSKGQWDEPFGLSAEWKINPPIDFYKILENIQKQEQ